MMLRSLLLCVAFSLTGAAIADQAKPKVQKPKTKPKPPVTRALQGIVQMPGDNGKVGVEYGFGKGDDALNFVLESAQFALRYPTTEGMQLADNTHKLLVLTFAAHNPRHTDADLEWNTFHFTVVSPDDENIESGSNIYHPERHYPYRTTLKPAQKVRAVVVMQIHPVGPVNKLIVKRDDGPVLRYDLRGLVKPLVGPFAKNEGIDVSQEGEAPLGSPFELGKYDLTVEKVEQTTDAVGEYKPDDGNKLVVVTITIKNPGMTPHDVRWNMFAPTMKDADGEEMSWHQDIVGVNSNKSLDLKLAVGESIRAKYLFDLTGNQKPARLLIKDGDTERTITVKLP